MADAKPSGDGGWNWFSFESIIGIILLLGLINYMLGRGPLFSDNSSPKTPTENTTTKCGLTITRPKSGEAVSTTFNLTGKTNRCNWNSTSDTALFAQVVDKNGKPVTEFIQIPPLIFEEGKTTTFNSTVGMSSLPAKGTGYLILIPAHNDPQNPISHRIPIKFK